MTKNIVIRCDGTENEYGDRNSNVVKLFRVLRGMRDNSPFMIRGGQVERAGSHFVAGQEIHKPVLNIVNSSAAASSHCQ